jgi:hypothetical protein
MQKLIVAAAAILITGVIGAHYVPTNDAQDTARESRTVTITEDGKEVKHDVTQDVVIELVPNDDGTFQLVQRRRGQAQGRGEGRGQQPQRGRQAQPRGQQAPQPGMGGNMPMQRMMRPQPGTWQLVPVRDSALLLNTATGETFVLRGDGEDIHWQPLPGPGAQPREMPRDMPREMPGRDMPRTDNPGRGMPRMPGMRGGDQPRPGREQIQRKLDDLRQRLKNADGDRRDQIKNAIRELEQALKKLDGGDRGAGRDGDQPRKRDQGRDGDRGRHGDELRGALEDLRNQLGDLKKRYQDTDNKRERQKIEDQINEIKEKANQIRKELKGLGK